jgi:hypothetical protein
MSTPLPRKWNPGTAAVLSYTRHTCRASRLRQRLFVPLEDNSPYASDHRCSLAHCLCLKFGLEDQTADLGMILCKEFFASPVLCHDLFWMLFPDSESMPLARNYCSSAITYGVGAV